MSYIPMNYEKINRVAGTYNPSMIKAYNNKTFAFWERALFQRACSTLEFNLPSDWQGAVKDFFYYILFRNGFLVVTELDEFGTIFQPCTLKGYDIYYQPTGALIANPAIDNIPELVIGENCELIKLTPDYMGIWDIINYYAEKLSVLDSAINTSLINSKFAFIWGARNKAASEALKKALDKINKGEPAVIYDMKLLNDPTDKAEPWQILDRGNIKDSYITPLQLQDFQTILNNFDTEIGIPTIPYQKKERMVTSEAESRIIDSTSRSVVWYDTLKSSIDVVNKHYPGLNISVKLRYDYDAEGDENE